MWNWAEIGLILRENRRRPRGRRRKEGFWPQIGRKVMPAVFMTVNGKAVTGDVEARTLLVQF
ncbi:MAG: hypothetical protein WAK37_19865, partial [Pseudolabrys sp.]